MTQRAKIRGAELKPCALQLNGINAERCVRYLRGIGVEIDDETADSWLDIQATSRFLASERRWQVTVWMWSCRCGHMRGMTRAVRGRRTKRRRHDDKPARCEECSSGFVAARIWYQVLRDGTARDYRPDLERLSPFDMSYFEDSE